jgi:hypothetical protein
MGSPEGVVVPLTHIPQSPLGDPAKFRLGFLLDEKIEARESR